MYTWFARDTCNSCFDKGLFTDFDVSFQYSLVNFEHSEREVTVSIKELEFTSSTAVSRKIDYVTGMTGIYISARIATVLKH